jgi:catechol 2,3-dioxygenase-like lactoylglutathione lyase family enzyme
MTETSNQPGLSLHHVGFVVARIRDVAPGMASALSARWDGTITYDPLQEVNVSFLHPAAAGPQIELIEPAGTKSRVRRFLEQRGGLHHLCYEVDDIQVQLRYMRSMDATVLRSPQPATAFGGRRIAWVWTKQELLVEYLERAN